MLKLVFGYVSNLDKNGRVKVVLPEYDEFATDYLPVIRQKSKRDKDGTTLDIYEEVALIYDSETDDGVVLGAVSTDESPMPLCERDKKYFTFEDGTHIEYDRKTHTLNADIKGNAVITAENITIKSSKTILGEGGKAIARIGDSVRVDPNTHQGTITSGGVNTSI